MDDIFDYYLRMVWQLALSAPLPYVYGGLFDLEIDDQIDVYKLSNLHGGQAIRLDMPKHGSIRSSFPLSEASRPIDNFDVFIDNIKLFRPIKFLGIPTTDHKLTKPVAFAGKCREEFRGVPVELSGGPLAFEAYLFWNSKILPTEHRGSLIRIHGASGTLFDPSFMRYQIAETTRLQQTTCEIFIQEGLDSALNIDRESFNYAHPHYVFLTRWLHNAFRQLATTHKRLAAEVRNRAIKEATVETKTAIEEIVTEVWQRESDSDGSIPPNVEIVDRHREMSSSPITTGYEFSRQAVVPASNVDRRAKKESHNAILETKLKALAQILAAYGLLDKISKQKQERLLNAICKIFDTQNT